MDDAIARIMGVQKDIKASAKDKDSIENFMLNITKEDEKENHSSNQPNEEEKTAQIDSSVVAGQPNKSKPVLKPSANFIEGPDLEQKMQSRVQPSSRMNENQATPQEVE